MKSPGADDNSGMPGRGFYERAIALLILGFLFYAVLGILRPLLASIVWGITLCVATWPVFFRLRRALGGRAVAASLLMAFIFLIAFLTPLLIVGASLSDAVDAVSNLAGEITALKVPRPPVWLDKVPLVGHDLERRWLRVAGNVPAALAQLQPRIGDVATWLLASGAQLGSAMIELLIAVLVATLLFVRGEVAAILLRRFVARIAGPENVPLVDLAARTIRGVANGVAGTAFIQGVLAAVGFAIVDLPTTPLLALTVFMASVLQLPTQLVTLPIGAWTLYSGDQAEGVFLLVWGLLVVGTIDNILRPFLIRHGARLPVVLVSAGVIGGLLSYGIVGVFLGPVILAVAWTLLRNWLSQREPGESDHFPD